jgi:DASH complex subunit DAD2
MNSKPLAQRLADKKKELQYLHHLQTQSKFLVQELEALSEKLDTLAEGTLATAAVMANWGAILHALQLASTSLQNYTKGDYEAEVDPPLPETLVRIRIDEA